MIRANAAAWHRLLTGPSDPRMRPNPGKWSALEYGCHVRDVLRLYEQRLTLMLTHDGPQFPNWDQDATAVEDRYGEQDALVVVGELAMAAEIIAAHFDDIAPDQWQRTGRRSDGADFTVESFGRYFIHDPVHHLYSTALMTLSPLRDSPVMLRSVSCRHYRVATVTVTTCARLVACREAGRKHASAW
jgi:hypothetical protein